MSRCGYGWMIAITLLSTTCADAQEPHSSPPVVLPSGVRARLSTVAIPGPLHGFVVRNDADSITFLLEDGGEKVVPINTLTRLEISGSRKSNFLKGVLFGAAGGVALGFVMPIDSSDSCNSSIDFCSRGEAVAGGVTVGVIAGAIAGALIRTERWTSVDITALRGANARGGRDLRAASLSFRIRF
jgi:hypothetical protein